MYYDLFFIIQNIIKIYINILFILYQLKINIYFDN